MGFSLKLFQFHSSHCKNFIQFSAVKNILIKLQNCKLNKMSTMNLIEKDGFFADYYMNIRNVFNENDLNKFSLLKDDLERAAFINGLNYVRNNELKFKRKFIGKSVQSALELKEKGNLAFKYQRYIEALALYTKSLIAMPGENRSDLTIIYANRSATLFHMEKYDESLLDINRAKEFGYPQEMMHKLVEREARCYLAKKDYPNSIRAFKKTVSALDDSKLSLDKRQRSEKDAMIMIKMLEKDPNTKKMLEKQMKINTDDKSDREFVSDLFRIDYNEQEGRYARACGDIKVGDEILIEKPNVCALIEKFSKSHCQYCFKRTVTAIPCNRCDQVIFCSEKCLQMAKYHQYECGILSTIWRSGVSINCHLALRLIACKPLKYFQELQNKFNENLDFDRLVKLPHDDYIRVYNLVRHEDKRNVTGFFQNTLMARFLTKCLEQSDYFGQKTDETDFIFVTSLILRNLQFLQYNTHEIAELHQSKDSSANKTVFIGGGIYPTLALFNHSCDPGIVRYFTGTTIHVNAVRNIECGLAISENYGPLYTQENRLDRQVKLKELYCFDCNCDACIEDWPRFVDMKNDVIRFRCDADEKCDNVIEITNDVNDFMVKCNKCKQYTNILKGLKVMQDTEMINKAAKSLYDAGNFKKALQKYIDLLKIMYEVLAPPFTDYVQAQQSIRDCFLNFGNAYALN